MRKLVMVFILAGLWLQAKSQNTGYLGKHVILKTDAFNGRRMGFQNLDVEVVTGRQMSFVASFNRLSFNGSSPGFTIYTGEINPGGNRNVKVFDEYRTLKNGNVNGWFASIGTKFFIDKIIPAPLGLYAGIGLGYGAAQLSGYSVSFRYKNIDSFETFTHSAPDKTNLSGKTTIVFLELPSVGYQTVVFQHLVLDAKVALQGYHCNLPDQVQEAFPRNYFIRPNLTGVVAGSLSFGPAVFGKVGVLIH